MTKRKKKEPKHDAGTATAAEKESEAGRDAVPVVPRQGRCALIDGMLEKGGMTLRQIWSKACEAFPDADPKAVWGTVNARPGQMRLKGRQPRWEKEPKNGQA